MSNAEEMSKNANIQPVPKLPVSAGEAMANSLVTELNDWQHTEEVEVMTFDTIASKVIEFCHYSALAIASLVHMGFERGPPSSLKRRWQNIYRRQKYRNFRGSTVLSYRSTMHSRLR